MHNKRNSLSNELREIRLEMARLRTAVERKVTLTPQSSTRNSSQEPPEPSEEGTRDPQKPPLGSACPGCDSLECMTSWKNMLLIPQGPELADWLEAHRFFRAVACPKHGEAKMKKTGSRLVCHASITRNKMCRHVESAYAPLQGPKAKVKLDKLIMFFANVANNQSARGISVATGIDKNTVMGLMNRLGTAAVKYDLVTQPTFQKAAVDETFIGKRKYDRGARPRKRGYWFATITEILKDGIMGRTVWRLVKRRDRKTLEGFVKQHLIGSKTVIITDCHKGYAKLGEICRHFTVNHSQEFKTLEGYHTNHAEGCHSVIKRFLRQQHNRFGISSRNLRRHVAIQCAKLLNGSVDDRTKWNHRFRQLLLVVRDMWAAGGIDDLETLSSDSGEEDDEEMEDALRLPTNSAKTPRRANTGLVDKRVKKEVSVSPPPKPKLDCESDDDENEMDDGVEKVTQREVMNSLRQGRLILSEAIVFGIRMLMTRGFDVVDPREAEEDIKHVRLREGVTYLWPVYYSGHWVLAVLASTSREIEVYDSLRQYAHEVREIALQRMTEQASSQYRRRMQTVLKACEQQRPNSNDCGVHVVKNAAEIMGVKTPVTRRSLLAMWKDEEHDADDIDVPIRGGNASKRSRSEPKKEGSTKRSRK